MNCEDKVELKMAVIYLMFWVLLGLVGCSEGQSKAQKTLEGDAIPAVVSIEGCQYLVNPNTYGRVYVHKGGCTNCWARWQALMKKEVER